MLLFPIVVFTAIVSILWSVAIYASASSAISYVLGILFVCCWTLLTYIFTWRECQREQRQNALTYPIIVESHLNGISDADVARVTSP